MSGFEIVNKGLADVSDCSFALVRHLVIGVRAGNINESVLSVTDADMDALSAGVVDCDYRPSHAPMHRQRQAVALTPRKGQQGTVVENAPLKNKNPVLRAVERDHGVHYRAG